MKNLVSMVLLVFLAAGCKASGSGMDPDDYCRKLKDIGDEPTPFCASYMEKLRTQQPKVYACNVECLKRASTKDQNKACMDKCPPRAEMK